MVIIIVTVPSHANAFTIFETLNDRGLDLSKTDLIKNYLFQKTTKDRLSEVQNNWTRMTAVIEAAESEKEILTYIRYFWSSRHGLTREKELYEKIKKDVSTSFAAISFTNELYTHVEKYLAILNFTHPLWDEYGPTAKKHLETLHTLRLTQFRPLVLPLLIRFKPNEVVKSLKIIVSWCVRNLITGKVGGGTLEKEFSERARDVYKGKVTSAKQLLESINGVIPKDKEFQDKFFLATVTKNYLARYYLRALENQARGEGYPELVPNENQDIVNLEHILPQTLNEDWSYFTEEQHQMYYKRIGNLALVTKKFNSEMSNASFQDKKEYYKKSEFKLTSSLFDYPKWGPETIEQRQNELAELALKTWNLKLT